MTRAKGDWLEEYKEEHPDRVHDPADDSGSEEKKTGTVRLDFEMIPPGMNKLLRMHWSDVQQLKKEWSTVVGLKMRDLDVRPSFPCRLVYVRRSKAQMDVDNLYSSLKIPIDALQDAGLIPEDDPSVIPTVVARQEQQAEASCSIVLEPVTQ